QIDEQHHHQRDHRQLVFAELVPHQRPLASGLEASAHDLLVEQMVVTLGERGFEAHCRRILGSEIARRISETRVPISTRPPLSRMKAPARYMSWLLSACSSRGPAVGRFSTVETMSSPEISAGSTQPTVEMNGLSATRVG